MNSDQAKKSPRCLDLWTLPRLRVLEGLGSELSSSFHNAAYTMPSRPVSFIWSLCDSPLFVRHFHALVNLLDNTDDVLFEHVVRTGLLFPISNFCNQCAWCCQKFPCPFNNGIVGVYKHIQCAVHGFDSTTTASLPRKPIQRKRTNMQSLYVIDCVMYLPVLINLCWNDSAFDQFYYIIFYSEIIIESTICSMQNIDREQLTLLFAMQSRNE